MTLNVLEPTDQRPVADLPSYIREGRVEINAVAVNSNSITSSIVAVAVGATSLDIDTNLSDLKIETVILSGAGVANISTITGGTAGQIKIFVFQDSNVSFTDGVKANGGLYMNNIPALSTFNFSIDDVLALVNIGGDGSGAHGYWKELWRQLSVK